MALHCDKSPLRLFNLRDSLLTIPPAVSTLPPPSELVAHERDRYDIAKHIGAEEVIYQDLADLKTCCASLSPRKDQDFEVGVFCGKYITSVPDGYFEHLEDLRGKTRSSAPAAGSPTQVANGGVSAQDTSSGGPSNEAVQQPLRSPADREDIRYVNLSSIAKLVVFADREIACIILQTTRKVAKAFELLLAVYNQTALNIFEYFLMLLFLKYF